jgi:hypothetical protein
VDRRIFGGIGVAIALSDKPLGFSLGLLTVYRVPIGTSGAATIAATITGSNSILPSFA